MTTAAAIPFPACLFVPAPSAIRPGDRVLILEHLDRPDLVGHTAVVDAVHPHPDDPARPPRVAVLLCQPVPGEPALVIAEPAHLVVVSRRPEGPAKIAA